MIAIQLALCMQLGTLCILSHLYSAPKLLEKASFKLEPQYERSVVPRIFHYGKEVGEMLGLFSLCVHSSPRGKEVKRKGEKEITKTKRMRKREERRGKGGRNQENKIKGGKRERKAAERGKQEVKKKENEWEKNSRKKKRKEGRGRGEEEIGGGQKKEGKKRNANRGLRVGEKKKRREKEKKKSSPQNRTRVPLMNGHNDRSCANLG